MVNTLRSAGRLWFLSLLICTVLVAIAFAYFDVATARHLYGIFGQFEGLANGLASAVLLTLEAAVALTLVMIRILRGRLSALEETLALACLSSICAYAINSGVLKVFFGVPNPTDVLQGAHHAFHFMGGGPDSSFPSGHMVLAGAFAGVFMRLHRASIWPLTILLFLAALLLILGDWHFVSDVIAGTFVGVSAGNLAAEVWLIHSRTSSPR